MCSTRNSSLFRNHLENAVRTPIATPIVTVSCTERDDTVEVRVADDGTRILDDRKERLFARGVVFVVGLERAV
ncbi:ATP-binding protein [Salarchaeum sp. III]|uniref:ATP-binding protein n=1 Tax=Salarchaeum sp. III TaxID=3107927 RepID=UPI002ED8B6F1